jgi:hypothetical protein
MQNCKLMTKKSLEVVGLDDPKKKTNVKLHNHLLEFGSIAN